MKRHSFAIFAVIALAAVTFCRPLSAADDSAKSSDSSKAIVPVFRLTGSVNEIPQDEAFPFGEKKVTSLKDLVERLRKAQNDKNVKAVILTVEDFSYGWAQAEELRQVLGDIRSAGKDIYAHADELSLPHYLLLSGATQLSLVPTGDVWVTGLHGESPYVRGLLNKIGVTPDFLTCGSYKSAAEMFMRESPSAQSEEMTNWLLDSLYDTCKKLIARGRGVEVDKVQKWIDDGPYTARRAREVGLIDNVQSWEEFQAGVKQRFDGNVKFDSAYGKKQQQEIDLSSPMGILNFYAELLSGGKKTKSKKPVVGIVYVEGPIILGTGESSILDPGSKAAASTTIRRALDKAAADDTVKALVLRVNSPGGSATASEIILNATKRLKTKKPLVVSMGNVAGSGGYYVACAADTIFADDATITGSIGVVGGKFSTTEMWNKVGINWKEYKRGANAALLSSSSTFSPEQRKLVQGWMDEIYGEFKGHVTEIRGSKLKKPIDDIAGGRVYTGRQALELGLVDKIGSLDDAIKFIAAQAKLGDKPETRVIPEPKNFLERLMEDASGGDKDEDTVATPAVPAFLARSQASILDAALPYLRGLDRSKVDAVVRALGQLQILSQEGVVLMTPEILLDSNRK